MKSDVYSVYILSNKRNTLLYVGVTNNLQARMWQHKNKAMSGFTKKYNADKLVYYEVYQNPSEAISREKQIKHLLRRKKIELIERSNPKWKDLYDTL
ncbi:MAG: hypothetical protein A3B31_03100 [Candidatus Komeilibacteria bacterium RIFCSPLOWO2_01_FULL_53_11]|uniref:GIY-YIG domain-containing protein n=1 Tax=Candidatus Komeilibacteria bacterium RIFCSPLOWO2_01_FULL_53_11 TaxID=1798552 RepID=A0A1G2BR89_9BACT|nr:MAG: hypothetical protein A3B31_03100 [Candidatus Komeilibacteria bacterium RIFCSPLOWO2_01_FULL_53_11]